MREPRTYKFLPMIIGLIENQAEQQGKTYTAVIEDALLLLYGPAGVDKRLDAVEIELEVNKIEIKNIEERVCQLEGSAEEE